MATVEKVAVLVAAGGAAWEPEVLRLLAPGGQGPSLLKRCLDLPDLLATATTGLAGAAVVSGGLPGLDADSVRTLQRAGVAVVLVAEPVELSLDAERLRRLGARQVVASDELDGLEDALAADGDAPAPASSGLVACADAVADAPEEVGAGRLLVVWGPAGAPGRTTVATGLAGELAARGRSTLLVDADPYAGAVAQQLGVLDEVSGVLAAARLANSGQLDVPRLAALCRQVGTLRVLTGLPRADRWVEVRPAAFEELLEVGARLAGHVLLDVGFSLEQDEPDPFGAGAPGRNQMTLAAVEAADEVLVVGAADPVGLARLARGLVELREVAPVAPVRVVVNRCRPSLGWGEKEVRGMIEGFVTPVDVHFLPDDRAGVDRALMAGVGLRESGASSLADALADLAAAITGETPGRAAGRGLVRRRRRRGRSQAPKSR